MDSCLAAHSSSVGVRTAGMAGIAMPLDGLRRATTDGGQSSRPESGMPSASNATADGEVGGTEAGGDSGRVPGTAIVEDEIGRGGMARCLPLDRADKRISGSSSTC